MKLKHALPLAFAACVMPTAAAQTLPAALDVFAETGQPYAITVRADGALLTQADPHYPYRAASKRLDGECRVRVVIDGAGDVASASVDSCTSDLFAREAVRAARTLRFASGALSERHLTINWRIERDQPAVQSASLN
jgi:TonB family protein